MRNTALAAALALAPGLSPAQPRPARGRPACAVATHTLAQAEGDMASGAPEGVFVGDALVAAWRTRGALVAATFDAQWRPLQAPRELARAAGPFALAASASGVTVAFVERDVELVVARLNPRGDAQNVPRVVAREGRTIGGVALARTESGALLAWSMGPSQTLRALALDVRGVPRGPASEPGEGAAPRLAWVRSLNAAALTVELPDDEAAVFALSPSAALASRLRWPPATRGPFELSGALYALQPHGAAAVTLARVPPGASVLAAPDAQARARYAIADAVANGDVVALVHDAQASRQLLARASPDGPSPPPVVVRAGPALPSRLALRGDGAAVVLRREPAAHGATRVVAAVVTCAR